MRKTNHAIGDVARELKWVRVSGPDVPLDRFPDFLIAGPQRTGTTWLHANLRFHPQIFLSEPKELFFFNRLKTPDHPRFRSRELGWYLRFFRDPLWRRALKHAVCLWKYGELYRPLVRGEATGSSAALDRDVIREITLLNPDIKVILMIRNPIDRAWSHAKKDLIRNRRRRFNEVSPSEFKAFFTDAYQQQCAHYVKNHDNWSAHLREGRLFVGLFDDIASRPEQLLLDVMSFMGGKRDARYVSRHARKSVNPTDASDIPEDYRRFLENLFREDIENLRQRFGLS